MTLTHIEAGRRMLTFAAEGRLVQGAWEREEGGRRLACMLGSMGNGLKIDSPSKCPSSVMPRWLAHLVVSLFDSQTFDAAMKWAVRFGTQMEQDRWAALDWDRVHTNFLIGTVSQALEAARPVCDKQSYWAAVESAAKQVQEALRGNGGLSAAWIAARSAAESAAESAAGSAAESAAWIAAWIAARSAAWSAAESAAWSAARSAARSAAESAAWIAARSAAESAAWIAARSAAGSAAESAAESAAWIAARSAAWSAAGSAAESAAESAAWIAAWIAARSAAESAAESAAGSAAESAAWSAAESAANRLCDLINRELGAR